MSKSTWLSALALTAAIGGYSMPAAAAVDAQISINIGPPAPRVEARPAPRRGMVWESGYWDWRGKRHVWVPGRWVSERAGYRWVQPEWVSHRGRWILVRGYWADARAQGRGDRDHDGIRNRNDRDRDGDGVPNSKDKRPDNPRRN